MTWASAFIRSSIVSIGRLNESSAPERRWLAGDGLSVSLMTAARDAPTTDNNNMHTAAKAIVFSSSFSFSFLFLLPFFFFIADGTNTTKTHTTSRRCAKRVIQNKSVSPEWFRQQTWDWEREADDVFCPEDGWQLKSRLGPTVDFYCSGWWWWVGGRRMRRRRRKGKTNKKKKNEPQQTAGGNSTPE